MNTSKHHGCIQSSLSFFCLESSLLSLLITPIRPTMTTDMKIKISPALSWISDTARIRKNIPQPSDKMKPRANNMIMWVLSYIPIKPYNTKRKLSITFCFYTFVTTFLYVFQLMFIILFNSSCVLYVYPSGLFVAFCYYLFECNNYVKL